VVGRKTRVYAVATVPPQISERSSVKQTTGFVEADRLWARVERLLDRASTEGLLAHRLGPLGARRLRQRGLPVPETLQAEERLAAFRLVAVEPLLKLIRAGCDGPLVVMKGPELALRYPGGARAFADLDLLVPDAREVHGQLRSAGFVEIGDPELYYRLHHLRPLASPGLPLHVEIHSAPKWPDRLTAPTAAEVIDVAVPSAVGVEGVLAPSPAQHALLVAAHSWAHEPLRRLGDILDVRAVAAEAAPAEIERLALSWQIGGLWRTTAAAADALFGDRSEPPALRLWARHLEAMRERTVFENHLQSYLSGYWALPLRQALGQSILTLRGDLLPAPEESWRPKLARAARAFRDARTPRSYHDDLLGEEATRGQGRNPPDDDA
jgi:Uncharacterised nucleotidyltransferase